MGGRGAASASSKEGEAYGSEYETLHQMGNVKFVRLRKSSDSASAPLETQSSSKGRVYATINEHGKIKFITTYGKDGKRKRQIDLDYKNNRLKDHAHAGYDWPEREKHLPLTKRDERLLARIEEEWKARRTI
jgi:hypothetical protein